jgi:hypothetical protein
MLAIAAGTQWSEDTLGLTPKDLARCVLTSRSSKGVYCVNFPLSTYSVFQEENVSRQNEYIFGTVGVAIGCLESGMAGARIQS